MNKLKKNIVANYIGKIWMTLLSIILIPYYIRLMGIESYGIVGLYVSFLALFSLLDLGLSTILNREIARYISQNDRIEYLRDLTRTFEYLYWGIAVFICIIIFLLAPIISTKWLNANVLSTETIKQSIYFLGLAVSFLWPSTLYSGALIGLQKQVLLNVITVGITTFRGIGMILVLYFISPSIQTFFIWQIFINFLLTALTGLFLWKALSQKNHKPKFDKYIFKKLKNFAIGLTSISVLTIGLTQIDKIILSKLLSLEMFGYYIFANNIAFSLQYLVSPIYIAFFPIFSKLIKNKQRKELKSHYHLSCQLLSIIIFPASLLVIFFSPQLVYLLTHNYQTVEKTSLLISLLMTGHLLNALMSLPYGLQLSYGWTKLGFYQNLVGIILLIPFLIWSSMKFGAIGACYTWILLNAGYILISISIMHKKIMKKEKRSWYLQDLGLPFIVTLFVIFFIYYFFPLKTTNPIFTFFFFISLFFLSTIFNILVMPIPREFVLTKIRIKKIFQLRN
jgi:O-antigen/teichoic acid export membrane protein